MHAAGEPSLLDRFLGLGDLYEAFETGILRQELVWEPAQEKQEGRWVTRRRDTRRPRNCDWSFALLEMLVDPVLQCWVPKRVVEQYERRNPDFRGEVDRLLKDGKENVRSNRELLLKVRRCLLGHARRFRTSPTQRPGLQYRGRRCSAQTRRRSRDVGESCFQCPNGGPHHRQRERRHAHATYRD